jgi:hypothetical protein
MNRLSGAGTRRGRRRAIRAGVVHEDNILWPTRGPNVDGTIGSTMRSGVGVGAQSACKSARSAEFVAKRCGA